jgi:hypothetical protein
MADDNYGLLENEQMTLTMNDDTEIMANHLVPN